MCHIWQSSIRDGKELSTDNPCHTRFWIDSYTLRYIEKIAKMEFDKCQNGSNASIGFVVGPELAQIPSAEETSGKWSKIQEAWDGLCDLGENCKGFVHSKEIFLFNDLLTPATGAPRLVEKKKVKERMTSKLLYQSLMCDSYQLLYKWPPDGGICAASSLRISTTLFIEEQFSS